MSLMSVKYFFKYGVIGGLTGAVISGGFFAMITQSMRVGPFVMVVGVLSGFVCAIYGGVFVSDKTKQEQKDRNFSGALILVVFAPIIIVCWIMYGWTHSPHALP